MTIRTILLCLAFICFKSAVFSAAPRPLRIACLGASITQGARLPDPERNSYPGQLQQLLGTKYQVNNFGVSSATLLNSGNLPYTSTKAFQAALSGNPDLVFIDLGGNDSKLTNRVKLQDFENDYTALIKKLSALPGHPRIVLLLPLPCFLTDTSSIWDPVLVSQIIPKIRKVAFEQEVEVLDLHSLLIDKQALFPDKIHPDTAGAAIIAKRLQEFVLLKSDTSFDVTVKLKLPFTTNSFYGYNCQNFLLDGRDSKIVQPRRAAPGRPWVWRARFWGHEPQMDIALLERGYHIVYSDVAELFGNPEAITRWNTFYDLLQSLGLNKKAAMEGMSRGGVYVFNWAAANPEKVACIYVENPVLNLKSWPGGLGKVSPAVKERDALMADYGLKTPEDLAQFVGSPVDKTTAIAKGGYPIFILLADADEVVLPEENSLLFEQRLRADGGSCTIVHKPGFKHHPHSLPNPALMVEFILKHSPVN